MWRDGETVFERSYPSGLNPEPEFELGAVDHAQERSSLVLELAAFFAGFATSTGRMVYHPRPCVALVLILSTLAAGAEVLDLAVVDGHAQDELSAPWLSSSMPHGSYSSTKPVRSSMSFPADDRRRSRRVSSPGSWMVIDPLGPVIFNRPDPVRSTSPPAFSMAWTRFLAALLRYLDFMARHFRGSARARGRSPRGCPCEAWEG